MQDLIERLEKATGPDRELDVAIGRKCGITIPMHKLAHGQMVAQPEWYGGVASSNSYFLPFYTASLDAALTLKPDGWEFCLWTETGLVEAYPVKNVKRPAGIKFRVQGHALPIALCVAALKARQSQTQTS